MKMFKSMGFWIVLVAILLLAFNSSKLKIKTTTTTQAVLDMPNTVWLNVTKETAYTIPNKLVIVFNTKEAILKSEAQVIELSKEGKTLVLFGNPNSELLLSKVATRIREKDPDAKIMKLSSGINEINAALHVYKQPN